MADLTHSVTLKRCALKKLQYPIPLAQESSETFKPEIARSLSFPECRRYRFTARAAPDRG